MEFAVLYTLKHSIVCHSLHTITSHLSLEFDHSVLGSHWWLVAVLVSAAD